MGNVLPTFRGKILSSFPVSEMSYKAFRPLNMGGHYIALKRQHRIPTDAPPYQRRMEASLKPLRKPQNSLVSCF